MKLRAVDLCCGGGGWAVAARGLPIEWVTVADIDADCLETWRVNHGADHPQCTLVECDLSTAVGRDLVIEATWFPQSCPIDLVVGGIPCEQVSVARGANRSSTIEMENWHRLIDTCLEIVDHLSADYWCFEDVIQIERHLPLPLFHGREIPIRRIQASDYSAQHRLRTFLGEFPDPAPPEPGPRTLQEILRPGPHMMTRNAERYEGLWALNGRLSLDNTKIRLLPLDKPCPTIISNLGLRGGRTRRQFTVVDDRGRRRMLSWQEAATVQGFPDDYLFVGNYTSTQNMVGRAIPIAVGRAILKGIAAGELRSEEPRAERRKDGRTPTGA
jgi:site-specific DNA-cytosine methylase